MTILTVMYFYLRAVRYSMMALEVVKRLGILSVVERIYGETPGANSIIQKLMVAKFLPYGTFTRLYFIFGPLVLFLLWVFLAIH